MAIVQFTEHWAGFFFNFNYEHFNIGQICVISPVTVRRNIWVAFRGGQWLQTAPFNPFTRHLIGYRFFSCWRKHPLCCSWLTENEAHLGRDESLLFLLKCKQNKVNVPHPHPEFQSYTQMVCYPSRRRTLKTRLAWRPHDHVKTSTEGFMS